MKKKGHEPSSRSTSSCAACKLLKRRCTPSCIFAPYFRADEPKKFAQVHKVFGASNVSKILSEVPEEHRQDAVNSLSYEAEARLRDPVYGCLGPISLLQRRMLELQHDLALAQARLARFAAFHATTAAASPTTLGVHNHYCYDSASGVSSSNVVNQDGHIYQMPLNQFETSEFSPTTDFGQVPLLPL